MGKGSPGAKVHVEKFQGLDKKAITIRARACEPFHLTAAKMTHMAK